MNYLRDETDETSWVQYSIIQKLWHEHENLQFILYEMLIDKDGLCNISVHTNLCLPT
jgi:hypothetical protein